ncbi:MAG: hypothetical protein ACTSWC_00710 [Promethearchaeota archaeon]
MKCEFCHRMATTTISNFEGTEEFTVCDFCEEEILREEALINSVEIQYIRNLEKNINVNRSNKSNKSNNSHISTESNKSHKLNKSNALPLLKGFI